jgi:hypothetical protein
LIIENLAISEFYMTGTYQTSLNIRVSRELVCTAQRMSRAAYELHDSGNRLSAALDRIKQAASS